MPSARYGEGCHASSEAVDGAWHASKGWAVSTPARIELPAAFTLAGTNSISVSATRPSRFTRPRVPTYCSKRLKVAQRAQQPVHFVRGVVVRDACAQRLLRQARAERDAVPVV